MNGLTIHQILNKLDGVSDTSRVYFDFANCIPTRVLSWREVYAEPALGWSPSGYTKIIEVYPTVGSFKKELRDAIEGKMFCGWKGGEYYYSGNEVLHVANNGDYEYDTQIVGVEPYQFHIVLKTEQPQEEW